MLDDHVLGVALEQPAFGGGVGDLGELPLQGLGLPDPSVEDDCPADLQVKGLALFVPNLALEHLPQAHRLQGLLHGQGALLLQVGGELLLGILGYGEHHDLVVGQPPLLNRLREGVFVKDRAEDLFVVHRVDDELQAVFPGGVVPGGNQVAAGPGGAALDLPDPGSRGHVEPAAALEVPVVMDPGEGGILARPHGGRPVRFVQDDEVKRGKAVFLLGLL